jgi:dienelactone hydrolase
MRPLEVALLLANVPTLAWMIAARRPLPLWLAYLPLLAVILAIVQIALEGYRWQMIPAYALSLGLLVVTAFPGLSAGLGGWVEGTVGWCLLAAAAGEGLIFPVFKLPKPDGPFAVGTTVRHLIDTGRTVADTRGHPREVMIQIWYPAADSSGGRYAPYVLDKRQLESPNDSYLTLVRTDAFLDVPVSMAPTRYPVLIYSPSGRGQRFQNTFLAEELASHGFVVVALDHPYGSAVTLFPDGRIIRGPIVNAPDVSSDDALARSIRYLDRQLRMRVDDVRFVLQELARYDAPDSRDPLAGRLDLERVGVFGYSFGGAVAAEACREDKRFKAGIDIEGSMWGSVAEAGVEQPFMFMSDYSVPSATSRIEAVIRSKLLTFMGGHSWAPTGYLTRRSREKLRQQWLDERDVREEKHSLDTYGGYDITIRGTEHSNFSEGALISTVHRYNGVGSIDPRRGLHIVAAYTLAFFEQYLNSRHHKLLDGPSPAFPEVLFTYRPPSSARPGADPAAKSATPPTSSR